MSLQENRKIALIVSKGGLDDAYPALILANAARQSGIEAFIFFTFYGLDVITEAKVDHLHVNLVGNATSPMPTMLAGLPGMENLAAKMMATVETIGVREGDQVKQKHAAHRSEEKDGFLGVLLTQIEEGRRSKPEAAT